MKTNRRLLICVTLLAIALPAAAAKPRSWTAPPEELERGQSHGVAVTSHGSLFLAPRLTALGEEPIPGEPIHVWSMATDKNGSLYLGTGPDGRIVQLTPSGRLAAFFTTAQPMVTALLALPDGDMLAAASPGGQIYRLDTFGNGEPWCDTERRYVWALARGPDGRIYAATGERGGVLRIRDNGTVEPFFSSDESHIVSLLALPDGRLLAGGGTRGTVYQIDDDGNGAVLYHDTLPEVTALAAEPDGHVLAALVAPRVPSSRTPEVRIRVPGTTQFGAGGQDVTSLDDPASSTIQGVIEGLGAETRTQTATTGRLVRIAPGGQATVLWNASREVPFDLIESGRGMLFGTGEPARLYHVRPGEDELALLATLGEAQVTALVANNDDVLVGTSNPAAVYRFLDTHDEAGVFLSRPFDAGGPARWGSIRWRVDGAENKAELYTRTGNSAVPDETWSAWSPALRTPDQSAIVNPDGRYLQWRARFSDTGGRQARVSNVTVTYEPYNRPPTLREFYIDGPGQAVRDEATFRWAAFDPDDDPIDIQLELRAVNGESWTVLEHPGPEKNEEDADDDENATATWKKDTIVVKTAHLDQGSYSVRAVVTDQAGNAPTEGRRVIGDRVLELTVDRTEPRLSVGTRGDGFEGRA